MEKLEFRHVDGHYFITYENQSSRLLKLVLGQEFKPEGVPIAYLHYLDGYAISAEDMRAIRKELCKTVEAFSSFTHVSVGTVVRWETEGTLRYVLKHTV